MIMLYIYYQAHYVQIQYVLPTLLVLVSRSAPTTCCASIVSRPGCLQVARDKRITSQMRQLLFGGGDDKLRQEEGEEEEPLPLVCHEAEHYSFVPIDAASAQCSARLDSSWTPPVSCGNHCPRRCIFF